jgi:putative transposase
MTPPAAPERSKPHRLPGAISRPGGWRSARFPWSDRDVPALRFARGLDVPQDARRPWGLQGGQDDAKPLKPRRAPPGEQGPRDAVCLTLNGARPDLWRAVEPEDHVLARLGQSRRHTQAAKQGCRKVLQGLPYGPRGIITAKLKSDGAAQRESLPGVEHRPRRSLHHRCASAQRPTRQRAYRRQGGKAPGHAQRFLSASGPMAQHVRPRRPRLSAAQYRDALPQRCESWTAMTGTERAA